VNAALAGLAGFRDVDEDGLRREAAEVGGLAFRARVPIAFLSPAELESYLAELFESEYPEARASAEERLLLAFGLLEQGGLREARRRLLLDNVVGFYDERPGRQRLYAVSADRSLSPANQLVLVHELRHALQDQHLAIHERLGDGVSDFDDRRLALLSLLEGDATLVMERYLLRRIAAGRDATPAESALGRALSQPELELPGVPRVLRDQLLEPYLAGLAFVRRLVETGGEDGLRLAWQRPPVSTEQVLHPEKYAAGEAPRDVAHRIPAPAGGRLLLEGVLGELLARSLLGEAEASAAAGWGGDAYRLYEVPGGSLLAWRSEWDSERDAREFEAALRARLAATHGAEREAGGLAEYRGVRFRVALRRSADALELIAGDEPTAFAAARAALAAR
jgi:hypothetical protein